MNAELTISDLVVVNNEPTIMDLRLAELLGYDRPRKIRDIIGRKISELEQYGVIRPTVGQNKPGRGRPSSTYYLNEPQSLLVALLSDAPNAPSVRKMLIDVFMAWRRGEILAPANLDPRTPAPVDVRTRDLQVLEHVRLTKGPAAAAALYDTLPSMPKIPKLLPPAIDTDAIACLRHLLAQEVEDRTIREWIAEAFFPTEKANNVLAKLKIVISGSGFEVPSVHAGFNDLFRGTPWPRPFEHLRKLPNAKPLSNGGGRYSREWTHIPSTYLSEA